MSSASRSSSPSYSSIPPPNAGAKAIGKRPRMSRFLRILVTATTIVQIPFVVAIAEALHRFAGVGRGVAFGIGGIAGVLAVFGFVGRAKHVMNDEPRAWWRSFLVDLPYYVHWCACLFTVVPSLLYVIVEPLVALASGRPVSIEPGFFLWLHAIGLVVCAYGVTLRRWFFVKRRVEIPIEGLDKSLDGYTIAQLSDLHIGAYTPLWWGRRWALAANEENVDLAVVTGDMVTSGVAFHEDIATLVGELRAKDGTYVVMGNHDYFGEGEPLVTLLRDRGVHVLRNEGRVMDRDGARYFLAGVDDTWTKRANLEAALAERPEGMPTILLQHDPDHFPHAAKRNVDLVLSGHTHGGQVAMPFLARHLNFSKLAHHFHIGVYAKGRSTLYVHPGLGTTGPPFRLGVAPEVVLLTLRAR